MTPVRLWGPPAILAAIIYGLSSISQVPGGEYVWDKVAHVAVFGVLAGLTLRATHGGMRPLRPGRAVAAAALVIAWGVLDEIHQSFVPGRSPSVSDVAADGVGVALALLLWTIYLQAKARTPRARARMGERG